jgi:cytochrome c-type biogenesis protein CcmH/NrfG
LSESHSDAQKAVKAKMDLGDFHMRRGEFDPAIAAYQQGLKLDPSNSLLRQKLAQAIKACKLENQIMDMHMKCGAP